MGSAEELSSDSRPEAASESPSGVKTSRKKMTTAAKKPAVTRSRRRHCRAFRLDAGRFMWPIIEEIELIGEESVHVRVD